MMKQRAEQEEGTDVRIKQLQSAKRTDPTAEQRVRVISTHMHRYLEAGEGELRRGRPIAERSYECLKAVGLKQANRKHTKEALP